MNNDILQEKVTPYVTITTVVHPSGFTYYEASHVFKDIPNRPQETLVKEVGHTPEEALTRWKNYAADLGFFKVQNDEQ